MVRVCEPGGQQLDEPVYRPPEPRGVELDVHVERDLDAVGVGVHAVSLRRTQGYQPTVRASTVPASGLFLFGALLSGWRALAPYRWRLGEHARFAAGVAWAGGGGLSLGLGLQVNGWHVWA